MAGTPSSLSTILKSDSRQLSLCVRSKDVVEVACDGKVTYAGRRRWFGVEQRWPF